MVQGHHEHFSGHDRIKGSSERSFGLVFTCLFLIIGLWPLWAHEAPRWWAGVVAAALLVITLIKPSLFALPNRLWFRFSLLLGAIVSPVVLGLVYFSTVTPIAMIMRALGKDPLQLRIDRTAHSYWIRREPPGPRLETMKNMF
jgi:saxitoxin biosynthesis operon SxtJ-like protein